MEDLAIARRCYYEYTAVPGGVPMEFPANPLRIGMFIEQPPGNGVLTAIGTTRVAAAAFSGVATYYSKPGVADVGINDSRMGIDYKSHPAIVAGPLWIQTNNTLVFAIQVLMSQDLAEEIRSKYLGGK